MNIAIKDVIVFKREDGAEVPERILWFDEIIAFTIDLFDKKALPRMWKMKDLMEELENKTAIKSSHDPFFSAVDESKLSSKKKELREKAWELISKIAGPDKEPDIYFERGRGQIIKELQDQKISHTYVYKQLRKFWQRGKVKNALLPDYQDSGGKGKSKTLGEKKIGRPRKDRHVIGDGVNVDEETLKIFRTAIKKYDLNEKEMPLTTVYELMIKDFYTEDYQFEGREKKIISIPSEERPTIRQFKYWLQKETNIVDRTVKRKGRRKFDLQHRAVLGSSTKEVFGPGSRFHIDATVGDVYLVSRFNKNWIIGRPVIYAVIDVFSRMIAGIYVGLEGPSWIGMMMALLNTGSDKVKFCKEYGIHIQPEEWECQHLPEVLLGDHGEAESTMIDTLMNNFHVKVEHPPAFRADWKGIVEQHFRTTNLKVKPFLPGFIDKDFRVRGGKDYRLDAKLNIYQFTQIIIKCALYHNNYHWLKHYEPDVTMIKAEVPLYPRELWNWGMKRRMGALRWYPEDILKLNLMPTGKATVTYRGIKFKNMYYGCDLALKEMWFEKARNGTWKVDISYDPRNMNFIYIPSEDGMSFEPCDLLESQDRYLDKTSDEIEYLLGHEELEKKLAAETTSLQGKIDLITEIENIVNEAEAEWKESHDPTLSKQERINGIRPNREIDKMANQKTEAFELGKKESQPEENSSKPKVVPIREELDEDDEFLDDIDLLLKKQEENFTKESDK